VVVRYATQSLGPEDDFAEPWTTSREPGPAGAGLKLHSSDARLARKLAETVRLFYLSQPRRRVVKSDSRAKIRAKAKPGRAEALRPFGGGPT